MKSDSNNHRTTPRSGNRNDAQGSVVTKGNSIGQSGTGNRYSVQSAYLSAINAKSSNYTVNNENAYPEYRPSKPIIITNQQQTFNTSHANAATTTAIANSATAKLISNNSKVDSNTSTSTTAANATTSKSQTTNVKKMENLQSRSLLHVSTLGRYDGDPEEKSPLNASNHALRGGSHHYRVQSRYLAAIHGSKSNDSVGGGMLENAHPTHSPLHKSSMMMSSIERSAPPTAAQHTSSDNMSAIELKRQYLLNRERSLSKSRDASESGDVIPLPNSKSNDDDEGGCCGGGGGGGKSSVSASTSGQRDMQSIYLSALKPSLGHKSAVELQKEYLMSRSFSQSLDDEGGLGKGMGMDTDRSGEERSPLITTNQANSKKKKNNSNSSSSSVQSMYLSASNPHSEYTSTATSAISSSPIVNLQPTSSNDSYGQQSSHDDTECVLSSRSIQQVASADMVDDGDMDHALREEGSTIIKPSIDTAASGVSSSDSKDAVRVTPVIETTTLKDNLLSGIVVLNQDHQQQQQQSVPIDSIPTHVPHGIMNTPTHIATQLVTPSPPIPVVVKDYTVLTTQSYPPCHDDILSALELEIMTLMRTEGWSRETAVRILLAKSSSESHSKANTTSDQQQNTNNNNNNIMNNKNNNNNNNYRSAVKGALSHTNMLSNDRHILGMTANNASNYHYPLSYSTSHQLVVSEQQHQGKVEGKIQWRQYQNHPMRGSQQSNSHHHHHHHAAVENASSSHTNRMFDHQLYIKETQKAPTNHHSVVTQEKQPHQHRVVQSQHQGVPSSSSSLVGFYQISGQGQGQGQGHHRGIPRSHARFAAAPDEGPDWGSLSSLSLSGSECEEGTEV